MHDAGAIIDLMEEGGAEEAEIIEGHAHILRHPMRGEDAGGVQTLEASSRGRHGDLRSSAPFQPQGAELRTYLRSPGAPVQLQTVPVCKGVTEAVVLLMSIAVVTTMLVVSVAVVMVVVGMAVVVMLDGDGPDVTQPHVLEEASEAAQGDGAVFSVPTGAKGQRSGPERADGR